MEDSDLVFKALADPIRRLLLDALFERDGRSLGDLEAVVNERVEMTRFGVAKHLRLLEEATLVSSRKRGREKLHYLNAVPIQQIHERWIGKYTERAGIASVLLGLKDQLESEHASSGRVSAEHASSENVSPDRASAEHVSAEQALAEHVSAEQALAEHVSAEQALAERASSERASAERGASAERASSERVSAERPESARRMSGPVKAEPVKAEQPKSGRPVSEPRSSGGTGPSSGSGHPADPEQSTPTRPIPPTTRHPKKEENP